MFLINGLVAGWVFSLTTGVDAPTLSSSADTVNGYIDTTGTADTFTAPDVIDGLGGTDTLNLTVDGAGAGALPGASITSIEVFKIREVGGTAGVYDFAAVGGETSVVNNKSADQVTFSNVASGASITVVGDGLVTNGATVFTMAAATDAVTLNLDGGVFGGANITRNTTGAASVTITSTGSASVATTAANVVGTIDLDTATALTGLTINATTNLTANLAADYAASSKLTVSGAASKVDLDGAALSANFSAVDASGLTAGGVLVQVNQGDTTVDTKFTGGEGNDSLDVGKVVYNSATLTGAGGNGTDTLKMNDAAALTSTTAKYLTGFETLSLYDDNDAGTDTFDLALMSSITSITMAADSAGDGYILNNVTATQAAAITFTGTQAVAPVINVKDAATVGQLDTLAITTSTTNTALTLAALTVADVETIKLTANTGTGATTITSLGHQDWTNLTLLGASDISVTSSATAAVINSVVDGSGATGKLTLNFANTTTNGVNIKGGSAVDTITGSAQGDTITLNGGADILATLAGGDTVTDFTGGVGGDVLDLSGAGNTALGTIVSDADGTAKVLAATSTGAQATTDNGVLFVSVATAADLDSKAEIDALFGAAKVFEAVTQDDEYTLLIAAADTGKVYVYSIVEENANTSLADAGDTVSLIGTFNSVSSTQLDTWVAANFQA